jgi:DNA-directed RNA polymerase subunit RPC12/RpoP
MAKKLVLHSRSTSPCCHAVNVLVRSRPGGFITQNCTACGKPQPLKLDELPELRCKECQVALGRFENVRKNYSYKCISCQREWELANLVPAWHERFKYHGFAIPNVEIHFG